MFYTKEFSFFSEFNHTIKEITDYSCFVNVSFHISVYYNVKTPYEPNIMLGVRSIPENSK